MSPLGLRKFVVTVRADPTVSDANVAARLKNLLEDPKQSDWWDHFTDPAAVRVKIAPKEARKPSDA